MVLVVRKPAQGSYERGGKGRFAGKYTMPRVAISFPPVVMSKLHKMAVQHGVSVAYLVRQIVIKGIGS
jgi:hypothetical protein